MTAPDDSPHDDERAAPHPRAQAAEDIEKARELAERLADTGDDIADVVERIAVTREQLAEDSTSSDSDAELRGAARARDFAEEERRTSRELRGDA